MFNNARNIKIRRGSFNINSGNGPSLDVVHQRVAPHAILNAGGRADEVRCHPGTREEVINRIEKWGDAQDSQTAPVFWLSGPAGAGKSAIMQTVAERCKQRGVPQANFFFFRADGSRSQVSPLIATLLHQIFLLYPFLCKPVATVLSTNPLLFDSTLEDQMEQLIVTPLRSIQRSSSAYRPLLLLVDGLDECDSESKREQQRILRAFDKTLGDPSCPFRLLVASRDESQIRAAFNKLSSRFAHLYLDEQYFPENDIRVFVNAQFEEVRKTHPLSHTLGTTWPPVEDVNYIVEKSSGQFIYAATVMRFISDSAASPMLSLDRVKGAARLATKSPFSHLDAIYTYILSQADDQDVLKDILCVQSSISQVKPDYSPGRIQLMSLLGIIDRRYTEELVLSCLADLTPIARYCSAFLGEAPDQLIFYHASFPDYLEDPSRSGNYFLDMAAFSYKTLPLVWQFAQGGSIHGSWPQFCFRCIQYLQKVPPGFLKTVTMTNFRDSPAWSSINNVLPIIYNLCTCDDDVENFRHILYNWVRSRNSATLQFNEIKDIPFGPRYYQMVRARHDSLDGKMAAALRPETDFDRHESSLWLRDLLWAAHTEKRPNDYKQVLTTWISWAIENDIPCGVLEDVPYAQEVLGDVSDAQQFTRRGMMKKWFGQTFKFKVSSGRK